MTTRHHSRRLPLPWPLQRPLQGLPLLLVASAALMFLTGPAQARERHTQVTGPHGQTVQRDVLRQGGQVQSSSTGPNGGQRSRMVQRSASGSTSTLTGANGQTASRVVQRNANGRQSTFTGPNGNGASRIVSRQP